MTLSRNFTLWVHFLLDQCVPPLLRDSRWFMWLPFKLLFGDKAEIFFHFKQQARHLTEQEFQRIYQQTAGVSIQRDTDLNSASIAAIEQHTQGHAVLDIACGRGFLSKRLAKNHQVTAADIVIDTKLRDAHPSIRFYECNVEKLPFTDKQFDTVICAHTLEHVQHLEIAISELRRVTARRLIIVLPKQRPYRYTFDLHLHFFPYAEDVFKLMGEKTTQSCLNVGGDWFYWEDRLPAVKFSDSGVRCKTASS